MQAGELRTLLLTSGFPVAYHHYDSPPSLPYLIYVFTGSDNFGADDRVYERSDNYDIELYTNKKDLASEAKIEKVLDDAWIYWEKSELHIDSEKLYQVTYSINI